MQFFNAQVNDDEVKSVVEKYRDEPIEPLHFAPSIELLINADHCRMINQVLCQEDTRWERFKAVPELWRQLPSSGGVYAFVWKPDVCFHFASLPNTERFFWVLYVGRAGGSDTPHGTIQGRYRDEYRKYVGKDPSCLWDGSPPTNRDTRLARYLTLRPLEFWCLTMELDSEIALLEKKLLKLLRPPINQQHGIKIRPGKPQPAF